MDVYEEDRQQRKDNKNKEQSDFITIAGKTHLLPKYTYIQK